MGRRPRQQDEASGLLDEREEDTPPQFRGVRQDLQVGPIIIILDSHGKYTTVPRCCCQCWHGVCRPTCSWRGWQCLTTRLFKLHISEKVTLPYAIIKCVFDV